MKTKKRIIRKTSILCAILLICTLTSYALPFIDIETDKETGNTYLIPSKESKNDDGVDTNRPFISNLDVPFAHILYSIHSMLFGFLDYAKGLCTGFCILCIIINAFKLWAGTTELKKAAIDILYKAVMCLLLINFYPTLAMRLFDSGVQTGLRYSNGQMQLEGAFRALSVKLIEQYSASVDVIFQALEDGLKESDKKDEHMLLISYDMFKTLLDTGMSEKDIIEKAQEHGLSVVTSKKFYNGAYYSQSASNNAVTNKILTDEDAKKLNTSTDNIYSGLIGINGNKEVPDNYYFRYDTGNKDAIIKAFEKNEDSKTITLSSGEKITFSPKFIRDANKLIYGFLAVMSGVSPEEYSSLDANKKESLLLQGEKLLSAKLNNIYMPTVDGKFTTILSIEKMFNLALAIAEMQKFCSEYEINPETNEMVPIGIDGKQPFFLKWIGQILKYCIYYLGTLLTCILIMCEYIITYIEFEFALVLSTLLIPLIFLDVTKSYTANILKTFLMFWMKSIVIVTCCFLCFSLFIQYAMQQLEIGSIGTGSKFGQYLFILAVVLIICKKCGSIASTVMSGNPSMGVGDVIQQASTAWRAGGTALNLAGKGLKGVQMAGKGAQAVGKAGQAGMRGVQGVAAVHKGAQEARKAMSEGLKSGGFSGTQKEANKLINSAGRDVWKQALKQKGSEMKTKMLTGQEKQYRDNKGELAYKGMESEKGKTFQSVGNATDSKGGKADFASMTEAAQAVGSSTAQRKLEELQKSGKIGKPQETKGNSNENKDPPSVFHDTEPKIKK